MENFPNLCLNCNYELNVNVKHCPACGQLNRPTELKVFSLIRELLDQIFNLNSRLFNTLKYIWRPSFLTKEYIAGRRLTYVNPGRLFIFTILIFFGSILFFLSENIDEVNIYAGGISIEKTLSKSELLDNYDAFVSGYNLSVRETQLTDSIRNTVFKNIKNLDSNYINLDLINFGMRDSLKNQKYLLKDIMGLSYDSIFMKYHVEHWFEKLLLKQSIKTYKNPSGSLKYLISNSFWIIILNILFTALFMKLLYIRRKRYLIEHVILLCNIHSLVFIVLTLMFLLSVISSKVLIYNSIVGPILLILAWLSFKRYYGQGTFKTIVKFVIYLNVYFFSLIIFLVFILLVSFLIF